MADSIRIEGGEALRAVSKTLREASNGKEVRKSLLKRLREAGKPAAEDMRQGLIRALPRRGGASKDVPPRRIAVRNRLSGKLAGVVLDTLEKHDYQSIEHDGALRHPKWPGNRERKTWRWDSTPVPKNSMTNAVEGELPRFRTAVEGALNDALNALRWED